jgi:hypothetical protein
MKARAKKSRASRNNMAGGYASCAFILVNTDTGNTDFFFSILSVFPLSVFTILLVEASPPYGVTPQKVRGVHSSCHCEPVFGEAIPDHAGWGWRRRQNRSSP